MKIVFSTKNVSRPSFLDVCRYAYDYGFKGFEIYDAIKERNSHVDSILRRDKTADSKRKLVNRNLSVSALRMPTAIESDDTSASTIEKYVEMASFSGVDNVIVFVDKKVDFSILDEKLLTAVKKAEDDDGIIVRFYDAHDCKSNVTIHAPQGYSRAALCDLMENVDHDLAIQNGSVSIPLSNFEIVTLKFSK